MTLLMYRERDEMVFKTVATLLTHTPPYRHENMFGVRIKIRQKKIVFGVDTEVSISITRYQSDVSGSLVLSPNIMIL